MDYIHQMLGMNGYALYVWPSFFIATCIMLFMAVVSACSLRRTQKLLADMQESTISTTYES